MARFRSRELIRLGALAIVGCGAVEEAASLEPGVIDAASAFPERMPGRDSGLFVEVGSPEKADAAHVLDAGVQRHEGGPDARGAPDGGMGDTTDAGTSPADAADGAGFDASEASPPCAAPNSVCEGVCVDEKTDVANCGGCGSTCGGMCTDGRCLVTLATGAEGGNGLAIQGTNLYWTTLMPSASIRSVSTAGGDAGTIFGYYAYVAVDTTNLYSISTGPFDSVVQLPLSGGVPSTLASGLEEADGIAIDSQNVYATSIAPNGGVVIKVPLDGGAVTTLAYGNGSGDVHVDATSVYFIGYPNGIVKVPIGGGVPATLAPGAQPEALAIDAANVYFVNRKQCDEGADRRRRDDHALDATRDPKRLCGWAGGRRDKCLLDEL
jgi:hypothetical protein